MGLIHWYLGLYDAVLTQLLVAGICGIVFGRTLMREYELRWLLADLKKSYSEDKTRGSAKDQRQTALRRYLWDRSDRYSGDFKHIRRKYERISESAAKDIFAAIFGSAAKVVLLWIPITLVTAMIVGIISVPEYKSTPVQSRTDIVALGDSVTSTGHISFFLGSGSGDIQGAMAYTYAVKAEDGIKPKILTSDNVIIKEVKGMTSGYLISSADVDRPVPAERFWRYDVHEDTSSFTFIPTKYTFVIPEGSIKYGYKVDLQ